MSSETEKSTSAPSDELDGACLDEKDQEASDSIALPSHVAGSGTLDRLVDTARYYAKASTAENTNMAYAADWKHFARWSAIGQHYRPPPVGSHLELFTARVFP